MKVVRFLFLRKGRSTRWDLFRAMFYPVFLSYGIGLLLYRPSTFIIVLSAVLLLGIAGPIMGLILLYDKEIRRTLLN